MTKDNLYKCEIYKDFVDLLVNLQIVTSFRR